MNSEAPLRSPVAPDADRLLDIASAMAERSVGVYADLVNDRFISGSPTRISREAPVVILDHEDDRCVPGGGGNAAANIAALGGRPVVFGAVGTDGSGDRLLREMATRGLGTSTVQRLDGYGTPTKTRVLGGFGPNKQQIVRIDSGSQVHRDAALRSAVEKALFSYLENSANRVVTASDYGYGFVDPALVQLLLSHFPDLTLLVDSRHDLLAYPGATLATPNQEEAESLVGRPLDTEDELLAHGQQLRHRLRIRHLLITRGSRGMALFDDHGTHIVPVFGSDQVRDVTGAGDTVIGTVSLALAAGARPLEAAILANFAAGIVVHKQGTATVDPDELHQSICSAHSFLDGIRWIAS